MIRSVTLTSPVPWPGLAPPTPSSVTLTVSTPSCSWPEMAAERASACLTTFVMASEIAMNAVYSTGSGRGTSGRSMVTSS